MVQGACRCREGRTRSVLAGNGLITDGTRFSSQRKGARGRVDAAVSRLLGLVESGAMEPDAPELRDRLVALRLQKAELDRDIARLHDNYKPDNWSFRRRS